MSQNGHDWAIEIYKRDMEIYKIVSEHYRQDLREFWSRSGLYILSQAFLFAGFATIVARSRAVVGNQEVLAHWHDVWFAIILAGSGALVAYVGIRVAHASMKWIHKWRDQMLVLDKQIDNHHSYCRVELSEIDCKSWLDIPGSVDAFAGLATGIDPNLALAYNNKGFALHKLNRKKEARQAYEKARQLGNTSNDASAAPEHGSWGADPVMLTVIVPGIFLVAWIAVLVVAILNIFLP